MKCGAALLAVLCILVLDAGNAGAGRIGAKADDVQLLAQRLRVDHPNLFHDLARDRFEAEVADAAARADGMDNDQLLVALMKIAALPGVRDGHTGIFPFDPAHGRTLHVFPLRLYRFADGMFVVGDTNGELLGARVLAVGGVPLDHVLDAIRPLVPRDNDSSLLARETQYLLTAEVLHGMGMVSAVAPTPWTFDRGGERIDVTLTPSAMPDYRAQFNGLAYPLTPSSVPRGRPAPAYLAHESSRLWTTKLSGGRLWYVGYNVTRVGTQVAARKLLTSAKVKKVRGVVVDLRLNGGGDNTTYWPLLDALQRLAKTKRIVVIISRTTFSAAENFATDLERRARPTFVGEASGGSPNLYGDAAEVLLPASGLSARIATIYWQKSTAADRRLATEPQVPVALTSADFFAGRDPVLQAAVRAALAPKIFAAADPSLFDYDRSAPLDTQFGAAKTSRGVVRRQLTFAGAGGVRLRAYWVHPTGTRRRPVVLFSPGSDGDERAQLSDATALARKGIASVTVSTPQPLITCDAAIDVRAFADYVIGRRRALDLIAMLPGANAARVAAVGFSFGAAVSGVLAGIDRRVRFAVIQSGRAHLSTALGPACPQAGTAYVSAYTTVDPVRYIGGAKAAFLFQNGTMDSISPRADVNALVRAARKPKEQRWYRTGHFLNAAARSDRDGWLVKRLS